MARNGKYSWLINKSQGHTDFDKLQINEHSCCRSRVCVHVCRREQRLVIGYRVLWYLSCYLVNKESHSSNIWHLIHVIAWLSFKTVAMTLYSISPFLQIKSWGPLQFPRLGASDPCGKSQRHEDCLSCFPKGRPESCSPLFIRYGRNDLPWPKRCRDTQ